MFHWKDKLIFKRGKWKHLFRPPPHGVSRLSSQEMDLLSSCQVKGKEVFSSRRFLFRCQRPLSASLLS